MVRIARPAVALCGVWLLLGQAEAQQVQWLHYRVVAGPSDSGPYSRGVDLEPEAQRPADLALPDLKGHEPLFARWKTPMLKAGYLWLVLDKTSPKGRYDRLYIDTDGDGRLDDESAIRPAVSNDYRRRFGPVKIVFPSDDGPVTYHLNVDRYTYSDDRSGVWARAACWYEAQIDLAGQKRRFRVCDYNANGTFNDTGMGPPDVDYVAVQDGERTLGRYVGKYLHVGEVYFLLEVARDGSSVRLTPDENVPMAFVRLPEGFNHVSIGGTMGQYLTDQQADALVHLPAGPYRVINWRSVKKDDAGTDWTTWGFMPDDAETVQLEKGKVWDAPLGEPLAPGLDIKKTGSQYSLKLVLKGRGGAECRITPSKGSAAIKARIRSPDGSYSRTLLFTPG